MDANIGLEVARQTGGLGRSVFYAQVCAGYVKALHDSSMKDEKNDRLSKRV